MMFDDYEDYDDYDDDVDDDFLYAGSDDDEYFMTRNGELVYAGDSYVDYNDYTHHYAKHSLLKNDNSKLDNTENELDTKGKSLVADHVSAFNNNPKYSDITLRVGPRLYHAHKIILCSWSEVFRKMFIDPSWSSSRKGETNGPGPECQVLVEPDECVEVFKDFLKFMYTETVELNTDRVYPILMLADKYMIQELRDACEDFLLEEVANISGEEALKAYTEAEKLGLGRVQERCTGVLEANIKYLPDSCVQSMDIDLLKSLLQSSNLVVKDEHDIYDIALQWLNTEGQQAMRIGHAEEILLMIRFQHMPSHKLKSIADMPLPQFLEADFYPKLTELISKAFEWRALVAEEAYSVMEDDYVEPRIYESTSFSLHNKSFSSHNTQDIFRKLTLYTEEQDDYYHSKLTFRAASAAEKNIYKYGKSSWEVSAFSTKEANSWSVNYTIQTSQELGHPYRVAVSTRLTDEKDDDTNPVITLHHGTVREKFTLNVSSSLLKVNEMPIKVWAKMAIFIAGKNDGDSQSHTILQGLGVCRP